MVWKQVLHDFWGPFQDNCAALKDVHMGQVYEMLDRVGLCLSDGSSGSDFRLHKVSLLYCFWRALPTRAFPSLLLPCLGCSAETMTP